MSNFYDVIIAGAGPIGLFLACELGLARDGDSSGISVLVLERDSEPSSPWKTDPMGFRGLNTPSVEAFYRRGLLGHLFDLDQRPSAPPKKGASGGFHSGGHFAGIMLDASKLELERWKYRIPGPALLPGPTTVECVETALTERAESLGVTIRRGHGVTKIVAQDNDGVTVEAGRDAQTFRGRWLVGCDGGRSVIRKAAEFDWVGTEAKFTGYVAKCDLDHTEKLKPGFHPTKAGMYIFRPPNTLYLVDFDGGTFDRTREITQEHLQDVLNRVRGITDLKITKLHLASAFTDRCKQATSYRKGRILLAGDAAHIHPPLGAQGLNVGLGDAMNVGWKLATTVRGERKRETQCDSEAPAPADLALLDTYESERHPIAAWVLEWNRAQVATIHPDLHGAAVQTLVRDLINTTDGTNLFIDRVWGLSQRYDLGDGCEAHVQHPLVGCSVPDFELHDGTRLGPRMEGGRGLLVDFEDNDTILKDVIVGGGGNCEVRVDHIGMDAKDRRGLRALLVRPDGIVAWVVKENGKPNVAAAKAALKRWFGC